MNNYANITTICGDCAYFDAVSECCLCDNCDVILTDHSNDDYCECFKKNININRDDGKEEIDFKFYELQQENEILKAKNERLNIEILAIFRAFESMKQMLETIKNMDDELTKK